MIRKVILAILLASTVLLSQNKKEYVTLEKKELQILLGAAVYWQRLTQDFKEYYYTKIAQDIVGNSILLDYKIYSKNKDLLVFRDRIEITAKRRKAKLAVYISVGVGAFALGTTFGYFLKKELK